MIQRLNATEPQPVSQDPYVRPNQPQTDWFVPLDHRDDPVVLTKTPLRKLRLQMVIASLAFTVGGLFIILNSPYRNEFLAPGPLTQHHAQLLAAEGGGRCSACHAAGAGSFNDWLSDLLSGGQKFPTEQVTLCMNCHQAQIDQALAKLPHTMPADRLSALTAKHQAHWQTAGNWMLAGGTNREQLACATCHREHHGTHFNLTAINDGQCQTCHVQSFANFETDHPPFTWDRPAISNIAFDHRSHAGKHFEKHQQSFDCQLCHQTDGSARVMQTKSFEESCASCHRKSIEEPLQPGIAWFRLPAIDKKALQAAGHDIGAWPTELSQGFDGSLTPFMKRLLISDATVSDAIGKLGPSFHFEDLEDADPEQLAQAATVIRGIKRLLWDLADRGPQAAQERLAQSHPESLAEFPIDRLLPFLNELLFRDAVARWLPQLPSEINGPMTIGRQRSIEWFPQESDRLARISHNPQDEILVPNPLNGKLDGSQPLLPPQHPEHPQTPARPQSPASLSVPLQSDENQTSWKNQLRSADDNSSEGVNEFRTRDSKPKSGEVAGSGLSADQQLLLENPLSQLTNPNAIQPSATHLASPNHRKDSVGNLDSQRSNSDASPISQNANHSDTEPATESFSVFNPPAAIQFSSAPTNKSGWFRDDQRYQLTYHPIGHADPFLSAWAEIAVRDKHARLLPDEQVGVTHLLDELILPTSAGQCTTCHHVDSALAAQNHNLSKLSENSAILAHSGWQSHLRSPRERGFTKFNHAPHLLLQDCRSCHQLLPTNDSSVSSSAVATLQQFHPIERAQCASCHRDNQAPNRCTTCHHYHVGELPLLPTRSPTIDSK